MYSYQNKWSLLTWSTLIVIALACTCQAQWEEYNELLGQPYCALRTDDQCCRKRQDDCSVPILGTLCYCDEFCSDRRENPDCCPDYRHVCLGESIPENVTKRQCELDNQFYNPGDRLTINCNDCTCVDLGDRVEIQCDRDLCLVDEDMIRRINSDYRSGRITWAADKYSSFWGRKLSEGFKYKLGTLHSRRKVTSMPSLKIVPSRNLPSNFSAEIKWPGKISAPDDQKWCAASWVYSTIGVASDRWAIMSKGRITEGLSFQHLLACNSRNQKGCLGGHLTRAWAFVKRFGIVSRTCYSFTGSTTRCRVPKHRNATMAKCDSSSSRQPLYRVTPVYRVYGEDRIKHEIFTNGPVQATMRVYKDLFAYRRGVYSCPSERSREQSGFHSVRITGWGEQYINGKLVPYWIAANSWGRDWGESGFFKVRRGTNECGIEEFILAVWADTSKYPKIDVSISNAIDEDAKRK